MRGRICVPILLFALLPNLLCADESITVAVTRTATCSWPVPGSMHAPINQQLVLLSRAADNTVAKEFLEFVRSPETHDVIIAHGFGVPR